MAAQWSVSEAALYLQKTAGLMGGMPREYVFRALIESALKMPRITGMDRPLTPTDARRLTCEKKRISLREHLRAVLEATHRLMTADAARESIPCIYAALAHAFTETPTPRDFTLSSSSSSSSVSPPTSPLKPTLASIAPRAQHDDDVLALLYKGGVVQVEEELDFTVVIDTIFRVPNWLFPHARHARRDARTAFAMSSPADREVCLRMLATFLERLRLDYNVKTRSRTATRDALITHLSAFFDLDRDTVAGIAVAVTTTTNPSEQELCTKRARIPVSVSSSTR